VADRHAGAAVALVEEMLDLSATGPRRFGDDVEQRLADPGRFGVAVWPKLRVFGWRLRFSPWNKMWSVMRWADNVNTSQAEGHDEQQQQDDGESMSVHPPLSTIA
jgi:hypothetical protein